MLRVSVVFTTFLFIFKPFGLETHSNFVFVGFLLIVLITFLFNSAWNYFLLKPVIVEENWSVGKEIIRTAFFLFFTGLALLLYAHPGLKLQVDLLNSTKFIFYTILIATVPVSIRVILLKNQLLRDRLTEAEALNKSLGNVRQEETNCQTIKVESNIVKESIETDSEHLAFIMASQNYVELGLLEGDQIKKHLLRISLIKALEQIDDPNIVRCHRSFAVNLNFVSRVSGNAQGLKLRIEHSNETIPVSRSFKPKIEAALKK